jgi:ribonuclease T2
MTFRNSVSLMLTAVAMAILAIATVALPSGASAQRGYERDSRDRGGQHVAGRFDYYQLVLSWSPTHCETNSRGHNDTQCGIARARPYSFVLHGLWPQYERGWPEFCPTRDRPFVPNPVIDSMMDVMPSRGLIIHQYKKHGTCSGLGPSDFFRVSRALFTRIKIPSRYDAPQRAQFQTPDGLVEEFVKANPELSPGMIRVVCGRGNANQLREIRICLTRKGEYRECSGRGRHQCRPQKMFIPPVR